MPTAAGPELRPGDIVLSLGDRTLSKGIKEISGGLHSHATIWTGNGVIEATLPRVHEIGPAEFAAKTEYMDALRHRDAEGRGDAIVARAREFSARDYNRSDLLIAIALGTFTAWMRDKSEWLARNTQYHAGRLKLFVARLRELYGRSASKGVTCVELVVRAHLDAGLPIKVKLDPGGRVDFTLLLASIESLLEYAAEADHVLESNVERTAPSASWQADVEWLGGIAQEIQRSLRAPDGRLGADELEAPVAVLRELELVAGETWDENSWDAALVTPHQLMTSSSLLSLGRIPRDRWR